MGSSIYKLEQLHFTNKKKCHCSTWHGFRSLFSGISLSPLSWYFILLLNNLWNYLFFCFIFKTPTPGGLIIAKLVICTLYTSICLTSPITLHMNDFLRLFLCCCFISQEVAETQTGNIGRHRVYDMEQRSSTGSEPWILELCGKLCNH